MGVVSHHSDRSDEATRRIQSEDCEQETSTRERAFKMSNEHPLRDVSSVVAATSVLAFIATAVYLYGFGEAFGRSIIAFCDLSDYAQISVSWIVPLATSISVGLVVSLAGWRIAVGFYTVVAVVGAVLVFGNRTSPSIAGPEIHALIVRILGFVGAAGSLMVGARTIKSTSVDWRERVGVCVLLAAVSLSFGHGYSDGLAAAHPTRSTDYAYVDGIPQPVRGNLIFRLGSVVLFRNGQDGRLFAIRSEHLLQLILSH